MSVKKTFPLMYKRLFNRYKDYILEYRVKGHERDIETLKREIKVHEEILSNLRKKNLKKKEILK